MLNPSVILGAGINKVPHCASCTFLGILLVSVLCCALAVIQLSVTGQTFVVATLKVTYNNSHKHYSDRSSDEHHLSKSVALELRQRERQQRYKAYCRLHGHKLRNAVVPGNGRPAGMMVVDKHKLLFCRLAKVGHSNWLRLILHMNSNLTSEQAQSAPLHSVTTARFFPELAFTDRFTLADVRHRLKMYFKVIFVRHPLDRLLSAYEDKLGEFSESRDHYLAAFGTKITSLCRKAAKPNRDGKKSVDTSANVTFSEFLCYVSRAPEYDLDWHWQPYWTFCQLCEPTWHFDFIGEYEHIAEESNYVLDLLGVTHLRYPLHGYRTAEEREERFRRFYGAVPPSTVDAIWRRFKVDFDVFGYKLYPSFWYQSS